MRNFLRSFYFNQKVFVAIFSIAVIFLFSFWFRQLYPFAWILTVLLLTLILLDTLILYSQTGIKAKRELPEKLSNSDENPIFIRIHNNFRFKIFIGIIDELPVQFQKRDFLKKIVLPGKTERSFEYSVRPVSRGEYVFGKLNLFVSTPLQIVRKRQVFNEDQSVKVYPSFIQMKKFDFLAIDNRITQAGLKKIRRIGHTQEFEQIKEYTPGDDVRSINWKATAKQANIMVNQFQEEKSQPVYSIIDTGRVMKMPFNGLSLLDYSINSCLAFSNVAIKKKDKVGMLTFSYETGNFIPASSKKTNLFPILETLYGINTRFLDSDFALLYTWVKRKITHRSLLLVYTNFEHMNALNRSLSFLKALAKKHVVVLIFFENTELDKILNEEMTTISGIAHQTVAEEFALEKRLMVKKLQQNGIQTVLTKPKDLTVNTINKYLEIKARGLL